MAAFDDPRLTDRLIVAAWRAGAAIMGLRGAAGAEAKDDDTPVTQADRESEAILLAALAELAPDTPVISEETPREGGETLAPSFFLVDPLDGTREFLSGSDEFTVNVALIEDGAPVFGLVYAPALSRLWVTPVRGVAVQALVDPEQNGAPDPKELMCRQLQTREPPPGGMIAAVSRSHLDEGTEAWLDKSGVASVVRAGSSLKFCLIAEGGADVYPRLGPTMAWDTAAGHAILTAAGGSVLEESGKPLLYGRKSRELLNPGFIAWGRAPGNS